MVLKAWRTSRGRWSSEFIIKMIYSTFCLCTQSDDLPKTVWVFSVCSTVSISWHFLIWKANDKFRFKYIFSSSCYLQNESLFRAAVGAVQKHWYHFLSSCLFFSLTWMRHENFKRHFWLNENNDKTIYLIIFLNGLLAISILAAEVQAGQSGGRGRGSRGRRGGGGKGGITGPLPWWAVLVIVIILLAVLAIFLFSAYKFYNAYKNEREESEAAVVE